MLSKDMMTVTVSLKNYITFFLIHIMFLYIFGVCAEI